MTKDEIRISNETANPKSETRIREAVSNLPFRHSFEVRISSFVIIPSPG